MRKNTVKQRVAEGKPVANACLSIPSGYLAVSAGHQGFNSVTVDLQHGMIGFEAAIEEILAIPMTETAQALENIDAILAVPGPAQKRMGELQRWPLLTSWIVPTQRILQPVSFCCEAALVRQRLAEGFDFVTPGNDFNLLMGAMSKAFAETRAAQDA